MTVNEDNRSNRTINSEYVSEKRHNFVIVELPTITAQNGPFRYLIVV